MPVFDINGWELVVILLLAVVLLGPDRLPEYAAGLARLIRRGRDFARGAREQVRSEMGPEFDDIDWQKYDPRRYHPRAIVRNALSDTFEGWEDEPGNGGGGAGEAKAAGTAAGATGAGSNGRTGAPRRVNGSSSNGSSPVRPARSPRPPAVRETARPSPQPTTWEDAARRAGTSGVDTDAT